MLVTDKPEGIPSGNDLDKIDAAEKAIGPVDDPAEIRLSGKILTVLERPPALGDQVTLMVKLEVTEECTGLKSNDELTHYRKTKLVSCWKPGDKPPVTGDPNQLALVKHPDENGTES